MEEFDVNTLETGDILLYHGTNYWFSYLIEWFTYSEFSHVSMVLKDPIYLDPKLEGLYILESGAENIPDAVEGKTHFGVQIVDLNEIIEMYRRRYATGADLPAEVILIQTDIHIVACEVRHVKALA